MSNYAVKPIDDLQGIHGGAVKLAGAELGIESFGLQVLDFPPGFNQYPEHDHSGDRMEEVYAVLAGSADFTIDGDVAHAGPGTLVFVGPDARRSLEAGPDGVRILAIGCTCGKLYERPESFQLTGQA